MNAWVLIGAAAALGSAAAWAVGSILFRKIGDAASPLGMNLGKGLLGLVLIGIAVAAVGIEPVDGRSLAFLGLSGLVGVALGDTFFFMALVRLDPRQTLLLATVGQVFTVVLAMVVLGERASPLTWSGIVLVIGGVTWVMAERLGVEPGQRRERRLAGIVYGLLASLCMSVGVLTAKVGVAEVPSLQATWIRLAAGMVGLAVFGLLRRELVTWLRPFRDPRLLRSIVVAVLVIMFGGFWLSLLSLKYIDASISVILTSTEPLFVLPLVALFMKERVSLRAILGATIAVGGVATILAGFVTAG